MVSKTFVCLALLALVAICSCGPTQRRRQNQENQRPKCESSSQQDSSNSNESDQQPCDFIKHDKDSEFEERRRTVKVLISQEDSLSKEIRQAPKHQKVQNSKNMWHQEPKHNEQKSRKLHSLEVSIEDPTENKRNQINRHW